VLDHGSAGDAQERLGTTHAAAPAPDEDDPERVRRRPALDAASP
jgi:hypothetical protein